MSQILSARLLLPTLALAALTACSKGFSGGQDTACVDEDADLYCAGDKDCDDDDPTVNTSADELWYDGIDQDCDGNDDDQDEDGVPVDEDCDDEDPEFGGDEVWYDGIDQDCQGGDHFDADGDGYASADHIGDDCDDTDPTVYPGALEVWYDGVDQDCSGDEDFDADGDGVLYPDDCDDNDPENTRLDCDCVEGDGDCDGYLGEDDCDDADATRNPGATEVWYDGIDQDCDGADDYDADADGRDHEDYGGDDCDDSDPTIHPDALEVLDDGLDSDCSGDDLPGFDTISLGSTTSVQGPRLVETDDDVSLNVVYGDDGAGSPGSYWIYFDPDDPAGPYVDANGWAFLSNPPTLTTGYDSVFADGHIVDAVVLDQGLTVDLVLIAAELSSNTFAMNGIQVQLDYFSSYQDVDLSWDGSTLGTVACEEISNYELVLYMQGPVSDYMDGNELEFGYTMAATDDRGANVCANQVSSNKITTSHSGDSVIAHATYYTGGNISTYSTSSGSYTDADYEMDVSSGATAFVGASSSGLDITYNGTSSTWSSGWTPDQASITTDGAGTLYVLASSTSGDVYLVYGKLSTGLTEVELDTGIGGASDVAVLYTSRGDLVMGVRSGNNLVKAALTP